MKVMSPTGDGQTRLEFEIPARGLIGFRSQFLTDTKGEGIMNHSFLEFRPLCGSVERRVNGALVSMENGVALTLVKFLPFIGFTSRSFGRLCSPIIIPV